MPTAGGCSGVIGIVLAAGAGRRLGQPKAEIMVAGERLVDRAVRTLRAGGCAEVLAVVRSAELVVPGARTVVNPDPDAGMGSSLRCGLDAALAGAAAGPGGADVPEGAGGPDAPFDASVPDACLITLVDLYDVEAADVASVLDAFRAGAGIVAVRRAGQRSHPVLVSRRWYAALAASAVGDQGGRSFFADRVADTVFVDVPDSISDIDTPQDLRQARRRAAQRG